MLKTFTLKNGVKVATYNIPSLRSVYIEAVTKAGSVFETSKNNGAAHFMEHMLVQGIPSFPNVAEFSNFIESLAGTYGASTDPLMVDFHINLPETELEIGVKITAEVMFEPIFPSEALDNERRAVINEINRRSDDTRYQNYVVFRNNRYKKNHPMRLDTGGNLAVVKKIKISDLRNFWKKHFLTSDTYLFVVGKFDQQKLKIYLEKYFEKYPISGKPQDFPEMTNQELTDRQVLIRHDKDFATVYIDLDFGSISLGDDKKLSLIQQMALLIFGRIRNSRLYKILRHQKGLVYTVTSTSSLLPKYGTAGVDCETTPDKLDEVLEIIAEELKKFMDDGMSEKELKFAKNFLTNQWLMAFDHPTSIASWIERDFIWWNEIRMPEEYAELIKDITTEDIKQFLQKYWDFDKMLLLLQGPIKNTAKNRRKYQQIFERIK